MSMINLMPPDKKQAIIYARRNDHLVKWVIGVILAFLLLVVLISGGLFYLHQDSNRNLKQAEQINQELEDKKQEEIIARVNELSGNLKLTVDVLSSEVLFSKLLTEIGNVMPPGTVLSSLTLNSELAGGLDLEIQSVSYESGVQAQLNLVDEKNGIFEKADISSVQCGSSEPTVYPCSSSIRVLFSDNNQSFLKLYNGEAE